MATPATTIPPPASGRPTLQHAKMFVGMKPSKDYTRLHRLNTIIGEYVRDIDMLCLAKCKKNYQAVYILFEWYIGPFFMKNGSHLGSLADRYLRIYIDAAVKTHFMCCTGIFCITEMRFCNATYCISWIPVRGELWCLFMRSAVNHLNVIFQYAEK